MILVKILFVLLGVVLILSLICSIRAYGIYKYSKGRLDEVEYQLKQWDEFSDECMRSIKNTLEKERNENANKN